jgi:hypothetical protein
MRRLAAVIRLRHGRKPGPTIDAQTVRGGRPDLHLRAAMAVTRKPAS